MTELEDLKARVRALEDLIAGPRPECPECITPMFPRVEGWRPGLVFSEESHAWFEAFHVWERAGKAGDPPKRPGQTYRSCRTCIGNGKAPETEEQRAERVRLKVDVLLPCTVGPNVHGRADLSPRQAACGDEEESH